MPEDEKTETIDPALIGGSVPEQGQADEDAYLEANPIAPETPPVEGTDAHPAADTERDPQGRFKKKDTPEPADTAQPESAEVVKPEGYSKAVNALKRAQTPQAVIDGMEPQAVIDWGASLAKVQAESDGYGKQVSDLRSELAKLADVEAQAEPAFDIDKALAPLREYYGDEGAAPIKSVLEEVLKTAAPSPDSALTARLDKLVALQAERDRKDARRELTESHPEFKLDKDDRWQKTLDFRGGDKNEHSSELEALTAACRHVFADEIISEYQAKLKETHAARDNGQPASPSGGSPPAVETEAALEDRYLNAMHDGDEPEKARIKALLDAKGQTGYLTMDQLVSRVGA